MLEKKRKILILRMVGKLNMRAYFAYAYGRSVKQDVKQYFGFEDLGPRNLSINAILAQACF